MSDPTASDPRVPTDAVRNRPSRGDAQRHEARRRIDAEHRRSRRLRVGWDRSRRSSGAAHAGRSTRRRRRLTVTDVIAVAAVAGASAWLLLLQSVEPTGNAGADLAIGSAVAVAVALVGAVFDRRVLVAWGLVAVVATAGRQFIRGLTLNAVAGGGWQLLVGLIAIGLASGVTLIDRRGRAAFAPAIGAASASLSLQCLASVPERNWPTVGVALLVATVLGALYAVAVRVRPAWLFD